MRSQKNADDALRDLYHLHENTDFNQLRSTVEANPHLGASVNDMEAPSREIGNVPHHLAVLNRAQFFEPEKFHSYAKAVGERVASGKPVHMSGSLARKMRGLSENYPQGDLREHAERLGLVDTPNPTSIKMAQPVLNRELR